MADIKTKDNAKGTIRTIDKAAVATQRMKQAYIATKEKAERSVNANSSSAEEYASDKLESGIDEVFHDGAYAFDKAGRKGLETTKENIRTAKDGIQRFKQQRAEQSLRKQASQNTSSAIKTVDKAEKTIKQSATSSGKKTIKFAGKEATKTAQKSVKTAEQTAKTAIKTSQQAAKAAQKTAQATVKASQKAAQAAKATAKATAATIKAAAKATVAAVKAIIAAVKGLDRKSTRLNSSHVALSRMPSSACKIALKEVDGGCTYDNHSGGKRSCCRHRCRRLGCGGSYYCSMPCRINCGFCVRYLLFGRGFRHGNVNADSRSGNQSRI